MPCTCNAICDNDCGSNQLRTGRVAACGSNDFSFTSISQGDIILATHLEELEDAINEERVDGTRRFNASEPAYCFTHTPGDIACNTNIFGSYPFSGDRAIGDVVRAGHFDAVIEANNTMVSQSGYGQTIVADPDVGDVIFASDLTNLQTRINQTRDVCICDSHCNCNPSDCGCNGECPSDDYYVPYYP